MAYYTRKDLNELPTPELSLFDPPSTYTAVEKLYYEDIRPTSQITTDSSPVEFFVSGQGIDYIDLKRSKLHVKAKILKADMTNLAPEEHVCPVNNWLHSLWSQIDVTLNGKLITTSSNLYPYKSYLKVLLDETADLKQSYLGSQLYYKDTAEMDSSDVRSGANMGVLSRGDFAKESQLIDLEGCLYEDFMDSERYLINGVNLQIKLYPTAPRFNIMSDVDNAEYKVKVEDIYLCVCKVRPNASVITGHAKALETAAAKYPFTQSHVKVASIQKGQLSFSWDQLFQDKCPNKVVVGLVSARAVNGAYPKNPFNFQRFDLTTIGLYVNGESLPSQPLRLGNKEFVTAYNQLFPGRDPRGLDVARTEFENGFCIFQFQLEPYQLGKERIDLIKRGNLRLDLQFGKATPETVHCVVFAQDRLLLHVDKARNILLSDL